jgi:hypothetical protein
MSAPHNEPPGANKPPQGSMISFRGDTDSGH